MSQLAASYGQPGNWAEPDFLSRHLKPVRVQAYGWQEPCESRDSRTVLWERRGEIPLRDPTRHPPKSRFRLLIITILQAPNYRPRYIISNMLINEIPRRPNKA